MKHLYLFFAVTWVVAAAMLLCCHGQNCGAMQYLDTPGEAPLTANAVSADGLVVVGWREDSAGILRAFRWTAAGSMQGLAAPTGGDINNHTVANGVSADGSSVVGSVGLAPSSRACGWTNAGGMQDIGALPGST